MASTDVNVTMGKLPKGLTMNVTVHRTREFRFRMWLAIRLISLAAWVLGCNVVVDSEIQGG